jgi:hypothetical protein
MKPRSLAGFVLLVAGLVCYGASGFVLVHALERQALTEDGLRKTEVACREQLVKLGRIQPREANAVEIDFGEVKGDPRRLLADVTAALAMCPGRNLQEVCLGVGCASQNAPNGAIRMTVRLGLGGAGGKS